MYDEAGNPVWAGSTLRNGDLALERWNNMLLDVHGTGFGKMFHGKAVEALFLHPFHSIGYGPSRNSSS